MVESPTDSNDHEPTTAPSAATLLDLLAEKRTRATARIEALERDFDDIVERSTDASRDDEHDPEGATIAFERAQVLALLDAERGLLTQLTLAEERVRAGVHGRCERCGTAIDPERLLARPTARTCLRCAHLVDASR